MDAEKHVGYGTIFSNQNIMADIQTPIGTIRSAEAPSRLSGYVHEYIQQLNHDRRAGVWVWGGDQELNDELAATMTLFLPGFFDADQAVVIAATESDLSGQYRDRHLPSNFLPSKLNPTNRCSTKELDRYQEVLQRLVRLPRKDFAVLMEAMRAFKRAILALRLDHLLAYSNLVFCLESLAQGIAPYTATWGDFPDPDRTRIEASLKGVDVEKQEEIKSAIVKDRQLRLTKRFVSFIEEHVCKSYFQTEALGIKGAIRRSELVPCLQTAYQIRSGYAHALTKEFEHIEIPDIADGETFAWGGHIVPTFRGLARLLEHVMYTVIMRLESVEREDINLMALVPGAIRLKVAPKHALARYKGYKPGSAERALSLVISHQWFLPKAKPEQRNLINILEFIEDAVSKLGQMNTHEKLCTLNLLRLYAPYLEGSQRCEWIKLTKDNSELLSQPRWPNLVSVMLAGGKLDGNDNDFLKEADDLLRLSRKPNGLDLPKDVVLTAKAVALSLLYDEDPARGDELKSDLVMEAAGRGRAQEFIEQIEGQFPVHELQRALLGVPEPNEAT